MAFEAFYKGFILGLVFVFSFGPIFFSIIETSIRKGFFPAMSISAGAMSSDILYVTICLLGTSTFLDNPHVRFWMGVVGGIVLIIFGIIYFVRKPHIEEVEINLTGASYVALIAKGFFINALNPFVFFFWLAVTSAASNEDNFNLTQRILFFVGTFTCVLIFDALKAFVAGRIERVLTPQIMKWVNRLAGSVMIILGARLLLKVAHGVS